MRKRTLPVRNPPCLRRPRFGRASIADRLRLFAMACLLAGLGKLTAGDATIDLNTYTQIQTTAFDQSHSINGVASVGGAASLTSDSGARWGGWTRGSGIGSSNRLALQVECLFEWSRTSTKQSFAGSPYFIISGNGSFANTGNETLLCEVTAFATSWANSRVTVGVNEIGTGANGPVIKKIFKMPPGGYAAISLDAAPPGVDRNAILSGSHHAIAYATVTWSPESLGPPGTSQANPSLPTMPLAGPPIVGGPRPDELEFQRLVLANPAFRFVRAASTNWFDPPLARGFEFIMQGNALFAAILNFPTNINGANGFDVSVGAKALGKFHAGQSVDFVKLLGAGVSSFRVTGLGGGVDATGGAGFPIQLQFDQPEADFLMVPMLDPRDLSPRPVSVMARAEDPVVELHFDRVLDHPSARTVGNYTIANVVVTNIVVRPDGTSVALQIASIPPANFVVGITNIHDVWGNYGGEAFSIAGQARTNVLIHRYGFGESTQSTVVLDSVGTAHGKVVNSKGNNFNGSGQFVMAGGQAGDATATYIDLPDGLVSSLPSVTIEGWVTWNGPTDSVWQRVFDFGRSTAGAGVGYMFLTPSSGAAGNPARFAFRPGTGAESPVLVNGTAFPSGVPTHFAVVYCPPKGFARFYLNGQRVASGTAPSSLSLVEDVNVWLGRSQWGDPFFNGSYDEFRIYDGPLSDAEVAASFAAGPNPVPDPGPSLGARSTEAGIELTWPVLNASGYTLQSANRIGGPWSGVHMPLATNLGVIKTIIPSTANDTYTFYQLRK